MSVQQANDYDGVKKYTVKYPEIINRRYGDTFVQKEVYDEDTSLMGGGTTPYLEACAKGKICHCVHVFYSILFHFFFTYNACISIQLWNAGQVHIVHYLVTRAHCDTAMTVDCTFNSVVHNGPSPMPVYESDAVNNRLYLNDITYEELLKEQPPLYINYGW